MSEILRIGSPAERELADLVRSCPAGAVIELGPGTWPADLVIDRPLTLVGLEGPEATRLVGGGRRPVVDVSGDHLAVTLRGLTVTGGGGRSGAGVALEGYVALTLADCVLAENHAHATGGGLVAGWGRILAERCVFRANRAHAGGALTVTDAAVAELVACLFEGNEATVGAACAASGQAELRLVDCRFVGNTCRRREDGPWGGTAVFAAGTERHRSLVTLARCALPDGDERALWRAEPWPGEIRELA